MTNSEELKQQVSELSMEIRKLIVMGMRPDWRPHNREIIRQLETLARAERALRKKALECELVLEGEEPRSGEMEPSRRDLYWLTTKVGNNRP